MILIALGANIAGPWGEPPQTFERALEALESVGVVVTRRSQWYRTAPFGYLHQPPFLNGVIAVETAYPPAIVLGLCHAIEGAAGRRRQMRWGPRTLDLDLLAYNRVRSGAHWTVRGLGSRGAMPMILPHPGIDARAFVLEPLREIAPHWRHPVTGRTPGEALRALGLPGRHAMLGTA